MFYRSFAAASAAYFCLVGRVQADATPLDEVVVSATVFREQALIEVPASVTVLGEQALRDAGQQHFQDVISLAPNVNWAAGSSRPRYFQIRGIGEREQYQGAPNSSVGFLIDDIDFSGIGMAATLLDVEQIEVLRGPQGMRYGANALAGLIAVRSADPRNEYGGSISSELGNYGTGAVGGVLTGPIDSLDSAWRLAVRKYRSDGFRNNSYLQREDTNSRDETTARGKWRWDVSENSRLDLTYLHVNLANGYDAFSIDNSRTTLSDKPGEDSQRVNGGAIKWNSAFDSGSELTVIATALQSDRVHAYDGDWGNAQSWSPFVYDYIYRQDSRRRTETLEARFASPKNDAFSWLVGAYGSRLREGIDELSQGVFDDGGFPDTTDDRLRSDFGADTLALFAQLDGRIADRWTWNGGMRVERRDAEYRDSAPSSFDRVDNMLGGQLSLGYEFAEKSRLYATVARGYKAGGFNLGQASARKPEFEPEYLWNYELGYKLSALDGRLYAEAGVFYMQRKDMQIRTGEQLDPGNPNDYVFVTTNVASGKNYGIEAMLNWQPLSSLEFGAQLGWLRTRQSASIDADGEYVPPREQAHAPRYQWGVNVTYRHSLGLMARVDYQRTAGYFFDVPSDHDQRSRSYRLVNAKAGFEWERVQVYAWIRNAFDAEYATRGFYFGNEPPNWEDKVYVQNGDPRTYGLSVSWSIF